jgi:hypothetical protein
MTHKNAIEEARALLEMGATMVDAGTVRALLDLIEHSSADDLETHDRQAGAVQRGLVLMTVYRIQIERCLASGDWRAIVFRNGVFVQWAARADKREAIIAAVERARYARYLAKQLAYAP